MSNTTIKTEYGISKPRISMFMNIPNMLYRIGENYHNLVTMRCDWINRMSYNPSNTPTRGELEEMEYYLNDLEKKANMLSRYIDDYNVDITKFQKFRYYTFFTQDLDDFRVRCRAMLEEDKAQFC